MSVMSGVRLPGDSTVQHVQVDVPEPGHGQVLLRMKASSICGSDIRAIYREHLGSGPEAYQGVIAGHEPCGQVVAVGPDCRRLQLADRVVVYHIAGCGVCEECRSGYMIGCTSPLRAAHGWQRDGGHAEYLLAEEATCILLPGPLTFVDGALVSCGFGTAYEGLLRLQLSGRDRLLITGLGPVGLAAFADRARALLGPLRDLFAATFFVTFGLTTDPADILPALPAALLLAVVTTGTKVGTGWYAAARDGVGVPGRLRAGTVLVPRGEFSIVIAGLAVTAGIPEVGPVATGYVLLLAVAGPVITRFVRPLSARFRAVPAPG